MTARTVLYGTARFGTNDLVHIHSHSHGASTDVARCGQFIVVADIALADRELCQLCVTGRPRPRREPTKRPPKAKPTAPPASSVRTIEHTWRMCADWDARYNGSIRNLDAKPLGSIL